MKALWFTDLHLRPNQTASAKRALGFILETAKAKKPDLAICTGDVFHTKNILYASMLEMFREFLTELAQICPVYLAPGNHDYGFEYEVHALSNFLDIKGVTVVDEAMKITPQVGLMAYARQKERFDLLREKINGVKYLFGHFDMNGFDLGSGWEEKESWSDPEYFLNFKKVFSGHYHLHQVKQIKDTEFVFCGTAYTTEFGESDQRKYIALVDLETGEWEKIETHLTLHKTLKITAGEDFPKIPEKEIAEGVEHRVIVSGTKEQLDLVKMPKDYPAILIKQFSTLAVERLDVSATDKKEDVLKKFVDFEVKNKAEVLKGLDQEKLLSVGQKLLSKVNRS